MKDTFIVNSDKARIAEFEKDVDELLNQVEVMKRYITVVGKVLAERNNKQANTFLDSYDEDYISDIIKMIRNI